MKAEELMIGDYISVKPSGMPIKVAAVHHKKVAYHAVVNKLAWVRESLLEPIPITPEILEKNGFEEVYDKYKLPNYRIKWNSYTNLYFTVFTGVDGYWNPIGLNVITGGISATVDYVHQLQHALRLCEIKKEIVL